MGKKQVAALSGNATARVPSRIGGRVVLYLQWLNELLEGNGSQKLWVKQPKLRVPCSTLEAGTLGRWDLQ